MQVQQCRWPFRQRVQKIQQSRGRGKTGHPSVNGSVSAPDPGCEREQDQGDCQRIEEQQDRKGITDDCIQPQIGDQKGQNAETRGPYPVGRSFGKHLGKGFSAAGDQSDCCFQACDCDSDGQDNGSRRTEIMGRDLGQGNTSIFSGFQHSTALCADDGGEQIDRGH